jgi:hypothetical protein
LEEKSGFRSRQRGKTPAIVIIAGVFFSAVNIFFF